MELIRGIHNIRTQHNGCVLTIGNFDGVHLGHAEVLKGLLNDAKKHNLPSTVMLFEPQPQEFFAKNNAPARLTRLRDKLRLLANLGIERVICISFNQQFANMQAEQFVSEILINKLGVKALTVGDDFRFGKQRRGNFKLLAQMGKTVHMDVKSTASFRQLNARVSSTLIREALANGELGHANRCLAITMPFQGESFTVGNVVESLALERQILL